MHVRLNDEPLEELDCLTYLGPQVAVDGGCERDVVRGFNEGYIVVGLEKCAEQ